MIIRVNIISSSLALSILQLPSILLYPWTFLLQSKSFPRALFFSLLGGCLCLINLVIWSHMSDFVSLMMMRRPGLLSWQICRERERERERAGKMNWRIASQLLLVNVYRWVEMRMKANISRFQRGWGEVLGKWWQNGQGRKMRNQTNRTPFELVFV